jgi:hypothetical protein
MPDSQLICGILAWKQFSQRTSVEISGLSFIVHYGSDSLDYSFRTTWYLITWGFSRSILLNDRHFGTDSKLWAYSRMIETNHNSIAHSSLYLLNYITRYNPTMFKYICCSSAKCSTIACSPWCFSSCHQSIQLAGHYPFIGIPMAVTSECLLHRVNPFPHQSTNRTGLSLSFRPLVNHMLFLCMCPVHDNIYNFNSVIGT